MGVLSMRKSKFILGACLSGFVLVASSVYVINSSPDQKKVQAIQLNEKNNVTSHTEQPSNNNQSKIYMDATFPSYTFNELNNKSMYIIEGKPVEIIDSYMVNNDIPFTKYSFKISKVFKGNDINQEKELTVLQNGNDISLFSDHPLMEINKKYILFLEKSPSGDLIMVGGPSGKFDFDENKKLYSSKSGFKIDENLNPL